MRTRRLCLSPRAAEATTAALNTGAGDRVPLPCARATTGS